MTERAERPVLLWLRRELRVHDNPALLAAVASGRPVLPVFVLDDATPGPFAAGGASRWWLHHSLAALQADLRRLGAPLVLRSGRYEDVIPDLVAQTGAEAVHAGLPLEPWSRAALRRLHPLLDGKLHVHLTTLLYRPDSIRTQAGGAYGVYSPFARACLARGLPADPAPAPDSIESSRAPPSDRLESWGLLPSRPDWAAGLRAQWTPGEAGAAARLASFLDHGLAGYAARRDRPGETGTAMLSPHLAFGEISPGRIWRTAEGRGGAGLGKFVNELLWREFSASLLWHNASLPDAPLRAEFGRMPWREDAAALRAWQRGRTGVPIVDAGMRQLWQTGWMHNRVRMVVASFLVKHLMIPWQQGAAWFWDTLVDADLASNAASWQWVAGSGADAAPYFRVFNPVLQGRKFDPDGAYVRRFVPELASLPDRFIHAPWEAPPDIRAAIDNVYPAPIVDLAEGRKRALAAYSYVTGTTSAFADIDVPGTMSAYPDVSGSTGEAA